MHRVPDLESRRATWQDLPDYYWGIVKRGKFGGPPQTGDMVLDEVQKAFLFLNKRLKASSRDI